MREEEDSSGRLSILRHSTSITLPPPLPGLHQKFTEYSLKLHSYYQVILFLKTLTAFLFH